MTEDATLRSLLELEQEAADIMRFKQRENIIRYLSRIVGAGLARYVKTLNEANKPSHPALVVTRRKHDGYGIGSAVHFLDQIVSNDIRRSYSDLHLGPPAIIDLRIKRSESDADNICINSLYDHGTSADGKRAIEEIRLAAVSITGSTGLPRVKALDMMNIHTEMICALVHRNCSVAERAEMARNRYQQNQQHKHG